MHLVINIKLYICRHVNYLGAVSHHHLQPVLPPQKYGLPYLLPPPFVGNVTILGQHAQAAIDVSSPFLHPTPLQHKHKENYSQQAIT